MLNMFFFEKPFIVKVMKINESIKDPGSYIAKKAVIYIRINSIESQLSTSHQFDYDAII